MKYTDNEISLKEFFEMKLISLDKALQLQAREYERRLDNLNNEAKQLKEMQATYLPRETYELDNKSKLSLILSIVSILVALGGLLVRLIK